MKPDRSIGMQGIVSPSAGKVLWLVHSDGNKERKEDRTRACTLVQPNIILTKMTMLLSRTSGTVGVIAGQCTHGHTLNEYMDIISA